MPRIEYVGGGKDPAFGKFIQDNWKPDNQHIVGMAAAYLRRRDD